MADVSFACLYFSYGETLAPFTDEECGRIMKAMIAYASTGETPSFEGNERFIWPTIQAQIDRDIASYNKRCEKNRANGAKGGRPRKQTDSEETQKTERFSEEPKKANDKDKDKDNDKDKDILIESDIPVDSDEPTGKRKKSKSFIPPTVDEVREYCQERNNGVDPETFVAFYSSKGWMIGKNKMTNWKNAVVTWERNSKPQPRTGGNETNGQAARNSSAVRVGNYI